MDLHPLSAIVRFIRTSGKRVVISIIGFAVLIAGGIMMVTPGPGIVVILAGLAILASEWAWAERALDRAKKQTGAVLKEATASPWRIGLSVALTLAGIGAAIWWFFLR